MSGTRIKTKYVLLIINHSIIREKDAEVSACALSGLLSLPLEAVRPAASMALLARGGKKEGHSPFLL